MLIIGSHVSFQEEQLLGCLKEAISYNANTFMFYTGSNISSIRKAINQEYTEKSWKLMQENQINIDNVICHAPYLINLANKKDLNKWHFSISFLKQEINRCKTLGIKKIVLHPGSAVSHTKEEGIKNIIEGLNIAINDTEDVIILLETMAGKGSEIGSKLDEIKEIIENIKIPERIGVCFDSCHQNDAGYNLNDFNNYLEEFENKIGLKYLMCLHINDSKNPLNSHKDRHENFGFGTIGYDTLLSIVYHDKLKDVPKILETPYVSEEHSKDKNYPPYKFEIEMIRNKTFNPDLINQIRKYYR